MLPRAVLTLCIAAAAVIALLALGLDGGTASEGRSHDESRASAARPRPAVEPLQTAEAGATERRVPDAAARSERGAGSTVLGSLSPAAEARFDLLAHGTGQVARQVSSGSFRFEGLGSGPYTLSAHRAGEESAVRTFDLGPNETRRVDLSFEPAAKIEVLVAGSDLPEGEWPRELRVVATPWRPEIGQPVAGLQAPHTNRFGIGYLAWDDDSSALDGTRRVGELTVAPSPVFWVSLVRRTTPVAVSGPTDQGVARITLPWDGPTWSGRRTVRIRSEGRGGGEVRLVGRDRCLESAPFRGDVAELAGILPGEYLLEATGPWGLWVTSFVVEPGSGPVTAQVPGDTPRRVSVTCTETSTGAPIEFATQKPVHPGARFELVPADASLPYGLSEFNTDLRPLGGATNELRLLPGRFHLRLIADNVRSGTTVVETRAGDVRVSLPCSPQRRVLVRPPRGMDWAGHEFVARDGEGRVVRERLIRDAGPIAVHAAAGVLHVEVKAGARVFATGMALVEPGSRSRISMELDRR